MKRIIEIPKDPSLNDRMLNKIKNTFIRMPLLSINIVNKGNYAN